MEEQIDKRIQSLLENSLVETPTGIMQMLHLSDLVETIGEITASITSVSASQLEKLQHNTTIATLVKLFEESYLSYIDPKTEETININVLMFSKVISPDIMSHIYIFDRDALEKNIDADELPKTVSLILQGKLQSIKTPVVVMYNSGDTPETENIDGNLTTMSYLDKFYGFGTKYGFALSGQTKTEYQMYTIYDLPNVLSYSNKVSVFLNYIQEQIFFESVDDAAAVYSYSLGIGTAYPHDLAKYVHMGFRTFIASILAPSTESVSIGYTEDIDKGLQDLQAQLDNITYLKPTAPKATNMTTTGEVPTKAVEKLSEDIADTIRHQLGEGGIYIESITINTVNIYTSPK